MLIRLDGTVVISLPDTYINGRLLSREQPEKAIKELNKEEGTMAVEPKRGCGYRKIGGLYLVSGGSGMPCDRLPLVLDVCPCSHGFKQSRGWTWVEVNGLVGGVHRDCQDPFPCPLCMATSEMGKAGLLWIGEKFYKTPADFDREGAQLGISRRISAIPRGFRVGETWVLLAHPKTVRAGCTACGTKGYLGEVGVQEVCTGCEGKGHKFLAGIFKVWRPERIEKILPESMRGSGKARELEEKGITPVFVPDDDPDHRGTVYDKPEDEDQTETA